MYGMTNGGRCQRRRKVNGGGCGTEEKHCPVYTYSRACFSKNIDTGIDTSIDTGIDKSEGKEGELASEVELVGGGGGDGVDFYTQACKALSIVSPFDVEDGGGGVGGQKKGNGNGNGCMPAGLASCLNRQSDTHKRRKKSLHLGSDSKKNKRSREKSKSKVGGIWLKTEGYFREVSVEDVEMLKETWSVKGDDRFVSIPCVSGKEGIEGNEGSEGKERIEGKECGGDGNKVDGQGNECVEDKDGNELMDVDGGSEVLRSESEREQGNGIVCALPAAAPPADVCSIPQTTSGVEWLLGSRSKIYLASERPSKKRKLLGGDAGLEKLFVAQPVNDKGESTCCHYCSLGDTGNQLNRLIVCSSCGVAVHQRCYGVQLDDKNGCWLCSWCRLKRDGDKSSDSHCLLCPKQGGALKPVRKRGGGNDDGGLVEFAHLFCCQWMAEVYIEDTKNMEPIMNIESIKETQKKLVCSLCKVKSGACVRCSYGSCRTSFHPVCAREAKHRMEIWGKFGCENVELRAFCIKHSETQQELIQQAENPSADQKLSSIANEPHKLKFGRRTGEKPSANVEATDLEMGRLGGSASVEDVQLNTSSNLKGQTEYIDRAEFNGNSTVEDVKASDASNFTLVLKKLVERGKVNLKDVATEMNVSANLLASNLADDCLPPDLHAKIVKWLKHNAQAGGLQKNLKLKVVSLCLSNGEKESGVDNAIRASDNNAGISPVKVAPPRRRTKSSIRLLKDHSLILSLKRNSVDDGVALNEDKNGGIVHEVSSPDSREKVSAESCAASDSLRSNTSDNKGDAVNCLSPSPHDCAHVDGVADSNCDAGVNSNLWSHDCSFAMNVGPDTIRAEASPGLYLHPLIKNQVLSEIKAADGSNHRDSASAELSSELVMDLEKTKRMNVINMSPIDEVEGELVYYQHQLLCNAVARKHLSDVLISKVMKCLPQEIEALRKQNWDAVLVSQYLSDLREVKKQGRKERRNKEAQAVLAAATAAAAASSRLSSVRKDTVDELAHQQNTMKIKAFGGRSALQTQQALRAKETHPKLSVTWTSPEINFDSSQSSLENKFHSRVCDVCSRAETILNPIIVCSSCKVAVHIDCYRNVKDSTGPWFCELCEDPLSSRSRGVPSVSYLEKPSRVAECSLCGGTTGAFRKSTNGQWVHAFCAEWVLESTFRRGQVKPIEVTEMATKGNDVCFVCSRRMGVCIKCNYGHCQSTFHPTCSRSAGFFMNVRTNGGKILHKAYCEKHSLVERTKAETLKHGVEEWNSLKKVRVELERLRLICERVIRREKLKRDLVLCSHDMLHWNRESISASLRACTAFVSPDVSSESATTSLRGGYTNSYGETVQRSDDITIDSSVAGKMRIRFPMAMDNDQKTDDSSTSQIFTQTPTVRPILAGKQIPHRPSAVSCSTSDDGEKSFRHEKHIETFGKELVMTSDQASMRNQRLPKGFVYVPIRCLSNEEETIAVAGPASVRCLSNEEETIAVAGPASEENSGQE